VAEYVVDRAGLRVQRQPRSLMDLMIAAHARALDTALVTNNEAHFSRVEGLRLEIWAKPRRR